ncbi:amidohydrolase [Virgibacillus halophilus]|uniref:amidohydrolase n=1 Tax=Tigheibacillus halophilus TaxID=361280 RepID=UPI0036260799
MKNADLLIMNANVLTLDEDNTRAGSVAVKDGRIIGVWPECEPEVNQVSAEEKLDLKGATLIPGFIDTHNHILGYARVKNFVQCGTPPNNNISDILEALRKKVKETPENNWVTGFGYDDTALKEGRHITRDELDSVSITHPILITHISGHLAVVNSKALELAGIDESVTDHDGGHFGRDANGRLNGVLFEKPAMEKMMKATPEMTVEDKLKQYEEAIQDYLAQGITTNTDAAVGMLGDPNAELTLHAEAAAKGINPMRTRLIMMHHLLRKDSVFGDYTAKQIDEKLQQMSEGKVRLDGAKMFQDGSIQGYTGALRKPYYTDKEKKGELFHEQNNLNEEMLDLHRRGFRIVTHGNGDRAIGSILDAYEYVLEKEPQKNHQHRIEHVQTATPEDIQKMEDLDVAGSFFINHVYYWGDRHKNIFLGPERARRISPLAEAVDHNLLFTLHSDCPVTPISPLFSVWAAVNRQTSSGEELGPEQKIDVITALKSMTIYGAQLNFDEDNSGSIEVDKRADFAVLEADPTTIDPKRIKDIAVKTTIIDGKVVYQKEDT